MRCALDTNILSAIVLREPFSESLAERLEVLRETDTLIISAPVFVELQAVPNRRGRAVADFLQDVDIYADFSFPEAAWRVAGERYARYAQRRRTSGGGDPKRVLADFLIGAHALHTCDRLFTLDVERYERDFSELALITI